MKIKKLLSAAAAIAITLSAVSTQQVPSSANASSNPSYWNNIPDSAQNKILDLQSGWSEANKDYQNYKTTKVNYKNTTPEDYKILFLETRNVQTKEGNIIKTTSVDDEIFNMIPGQFEEIVEYLSDYNVNIITDTLVVDDLVKATADYVQSENILKYVNDYAAYGDYDSVLTYSPDSKLLGGCPNSSYGVHEFPSGFAYGWCPISVLDMTADHTAVKTERKNQSEHLYSVDLAIHEWMHQLERIRNFTTPSEIPIFMPSADILKLDDAKEKTGNSKVITNDYYTWDNIFYNIANDKKMSKTGRNAQFLAGSEPVNISYAHAFLTGTLYKNNSIITNTSIIDANYQKIYNATYNCNRYVGMFPSFWKLFDGKAYLGEFIAQSTNKNFNGKIVSYPDTSIAGYTLSESIYSSQVKDYVWRLHYSLIDNQLHICFTKSGYYGRIDQLWDIKGVAMSECKFIETDKFIFNSDGPTTTTAKPVTTTKKATTTTAKPVTTTKKVTTTTAKPVTTTKKATTTTAKPVTTTKKVTTTTAKPVTTTKKATTTTAKPVTTTKKATTTTAKPVTTTKKATTTTAKPVTTTKKATTTTAKPVTTTKKVTTTTAKPVTTTKKATTTTAKPVTTTKKVTTTTAKPVTTTKKATTTTAKPVITTKKATTTTAKPVTTTKKVTTTTAKPVTTTKKATTTPKATTTTTKTTTTTPIKVTVYGDANCDKNVDISDVVLLKSWVLNSKKYEVSKQGLANSDVQGNGNGVNSNDIIAIQKFSLKLIDKLPVE